MSTEDTLIDVEMENLMLTTIDNPFNPKEEYIKWRQWDIEHHYNTEEYLARLVSLPTDMELDNDPMIKALTTQAIFSILEHDELGIYKLV